MFQSTVINHHYMNDFKSYLIKNESTPVIV